jgi:hypothetical protein
MPIVPGDKPAFPWRALYDAGAAGVVRSRGRPRTSIFAIDRIPQRGEIP